MSLVFIRLDKIGDLVATLSVDQHNALKNSQVEWVIAKGLESIMQSAVPERKFLSLDVSKKNWRQSYAQLLHYLQEKKPRAVIVFYAPWWVSLACWRARVPWRVARASQWHSFLFFNQCIRQKRSLSEMHEHEYNLQLVEVGLDLPHRPPANLKLTAQDNPELLKKYELTTNRYYVVHPGMFGSALNWPQSKYNELIEKLIQQNPVVITGTKNDERFLTEIKTKWLGNPQVKMLQEKLSFPELLTVLNNAKACIAPSTGILHLAAALGKKSVGIYSPILAHHPTRWGPRGPDVHVLLPKASCPAKSRCLKDKCEFHPCMDSISVDSVMTALESAPHA